MSADSLQALHVIFFVIAAWYLTEGHSKILVLILPYVLWHSCVQTRKDFVTPLFNFNQILYFTFGSLALVNSGFATVTCFHT